MERLVRKQEQNLIRFKYFKNMTFLWKNIEDNTSPTIRAVRIILLVMIIVGLALIFTRDWWLPSVVNYLL